MHKYTFEIPELLRILDNKEEEDINLANHKFVIKALIGKLND